MISRASLFNKGIYKSTLRRYLWGSVLYFILLFMITGMSILLNYSHDYRYLPMVNGRQTSIILSNEFILLPILLSIAVPTIAGLLIFRFIHSKKTSVFVHSLPVKRTANYISSVLAGLTLMIAPIIINTAVLMIISLSGYSQYFTVSDCATWMLLNIFSIFIMFSCVCFVAVLTGNSFAMIVLNILFHTFIPLLTAGFSLVCEKFLHGFAGENELLTRVVNNNFPARIMSIVSSWNYEHITAKSYTSDFVKFSLIAIVLYVISAVFYKARKMETAEDVAGFKCLNPIFKYLITFMGAIAAFSIFSDSIDENEFIFWCLVALVSAVIYFASEMLLKKTFKVWHTYKGYLVFAAAFSVLMCLFSLTSFFGFETNIPPKDKIANVAVYDYYRNEKPLVANADVIDRALNIHGKMIANAQRIKKMGETAIHIEYQLENKKIIHRRYPITEDELHEIMNSLYKNEEYKMKREEVFEEAEEIYKASINHNYGSEDILDKEKLAALNECVKADIMELDYDELYNNSWNFNIELDFIVNDEKEGYYNTWQGVDDDGKRIKVRYLHLNVNPNYKRTMQWIKDNGYWEMVKIKNEGFIYICKEWENLPFVGKTLDIAAGESVISKKEEKDIIKLENQEDIERLIEYAHTAPSRYISQDKRYTVYQIKDEANKDYIFLTRMTKEEIEALFPEKDFSGKFN